MAGLCKRCGLEYIATEPDKVTCPLCDCCQECGCCPCFTCEECCEQYFGGIPDWVTAKMLEAMTMNAQKWGLYD